MTTQPDRGALSLEQIEQDAWGDPPADASRLVRTAHELRRRPVALLTVEDLRLLIAQKIGVGGAGTAGAGHTCGRSAGRRRLLPGGSARGCHEAAHELLAGPC